jgi:hypothetical protein
MMETIGTVLDRLEAQQAMSLQLKPDAISLDLLQAVYRNNQLPLTVRLRAAIAALPHEVPKLIAQAILNEQSYAELLDRRLARMKEVEAKLIEQQPPQIESKPPLSHTPDRRFRRI